MKVEIVVTVDVEEGEPPDHTTEVEWEEDAAEAVGRCVRFGLKNFFPGFKLLSVEKLDYTHATQFDATCPDCGCVFYPEVEESEPS